LPPCTPAYDFTDFTPNTGDWNRDIEVVAVDGADPYASVRANVDDVAGFWWDDPLDPALCFHSIRVEKVGGTDHGLFVYCEDDLGMSVRFEAPTSYAYVKYSDDTGIPDSAGLDLTGRTLEGFRISFGPSSLISEVRADGTWAKLDEIPLPDWLTNCELGYDMFDETEDASHVDDWSSDPPPTSLVALPP
jgi:hypothetical protein